MRGLSPAAQARSTPALRPAAEVRGYSGADFMCDDPEGVAERFACGSLPDRVS